MREIICKKDSSIKETMEKINKNTKGMVFLVDDSNAICGILTDGDIRRALINGYGLKDMASDVMKTDFVYVFNTDSQKDVKDKLSKDIRIIPIVDKEMHIVDYEEYDPSPSRLSLATPHLNGNEYKYLMDAFLSTWISSAGKYINSFEESFAKWCGMNYGVATSSGTTALHLALLALDIGNGDEVIIPNLTFAATINAVLYTGATPVIVDIDRDSWCINPKSIESALTNRTRAIIPVHLYGQPCDMDEIRKIAKENRLFIIEDCAEAHGAKWKGKRVGGFGEISCFSFYGNKVITTGEGGMCLTNDSKLAEKMRVLRDHGMKKGRRYYHEVVGYNYRMTNMQAAIGTAQVEHIDEIIEWRHKLEETYRKVFKEDSRIEIQRNNLPCREKISWLVSILVEEDKRDKITNKLKENGIDVRSFFVPLSEMEIYKEYVTEAGCPISIEISKRGLNLPTTYDMNEEAVKRVCNVVKEAL